MRVLYLTNKPIFPLVDGGCVAMHQFLKCLLNAGYNVKNFTISTPKHPFEIDKYPSKLSSIIQPEGYFIDTTLSAINAAKSLLINSSFLYLIPVTVSIILISTAKSIKPLNLDDSINISLISASGSGFLSSLVMLIY